MFFAILFIFFIKNSHAGFLIQGGIGAKFNQIEVSDFYKNSIKTSDNFISTDFNLGIGYTFETGNNFKPSVILAYSVQEGEISKTQIIQKRQYEMKLKNFSNADFFTQIAYKFSNSTIYANLGGSLIIFDAERSVSLLNNKVTSETKNILVGVLLGIGVEKKMYKNLGFFGEINLRYGVEEKEIGTLGHKVGGKIGNANFLFGFRYHF